MSAPGCKSIQDEVNKNIEFEKIVAERALKRAKHEEIDKDERL